tara:strand:- start:3 stop:329 length:327 start_codon:yes stop_codon:yes gene_type:complete
MYLILEVSPGRRLDVISDWIELTGNCIINLVCSALAALVEDGVTVLSDADVCPWITKVSRISEAPMLAFVPRVRRLSLNAFVIVLSLVAKYFLIAILSHHPGNVNAWI